MKYSAQILRRKSRQAGPGISLFPFLAVLICTMGALVPLLVAISRTARQQAESAAQAKAAEQGTEVQELREDTQWRAELLKQSRQKTQEQLAETRLQLGHLEDHSRRLREKLSEFQKAEADLDRLESNGRQRVVQSQAELDQIRSQLGDAQRKLDEARRASAGKKCSFAVVPYEGPNQTRRRPIYLECLPDAVVIQPEGIELTVADFEGPLGPGNPLAAALRAAREYMLSQRNFDPQAGEPYPLLLVRPRGISAYYAARAAMKSWGGDFGYELIGDDWKLAYQTPDARLAEVVRQTISAARANQARLIAAAPRHYSHRPKVTYRATPSRGGFVAEGGSAEGGGTDYRQARASGPVGRNEASGSGGQGSGGGQVAGVGNGNSQGNGVGGQGASGEGLGTGDGGSGTVSSGGLVAGGGGLGTGGAGGSGNGGGGLGSGGGALGAGGGGLGTGGGSGPYPSTPMNGDPANGPSLTMGEGNGTSSSASAGRAGGTSDGGGDGSGGGGSGGGGFSGNPCRSSTEPSDTGTAGESVNKYVTNFSQGNSPQGASGGSVSAFSRGNSPQGASGGSVSTATSPRSNSLPPGDGTILGSSDPQSGQPGGGGTVERPEGYVVGQPPREREAPSRQPSPDDEQGSSKVAQGRVMRPGEWEPRPEPPPRMPEDKGDKKDEHHKRSLAEKRGPDWGIRDAARGSVGVTRPIRIDCYADRLVVVSERGPAANKTIVFGSQTELSINALVSAVWERIESWGIAGRGMYWRPRLLVHVAPGAEDRFTELSSLLEGSGLTVEKK